jgi:hypothetical protein
MAGEEGLEPPKCQDQNLVPYHLATPQYLCSNRVILPHFVQSFNLFEVATHLCQATSSKICRAGLLLGYESHNSAT